jgi:hypothetical protein
MSDALIRLGRSWWLTPLVLAAYALLAVLMTWPVAAQINTAYAGARSDLWIHQWTFWWVKQALATGQNPFYTTMLYYPQGVALTSHNIAWFNIAVWLPLQAVVGEIAAYNLIFMGIFALNGFAFYLFATEVTRRRAASFVGGIVFGFWPYTLSHYDHPNMIVTFWVPLTLLFVRRALRRGSVGYALLAGVTLAMVGISRWQLLAMSSPLLIAVVFYELTRAGHGRGSFPWRRVGLLLLTGGLALLLMAPLGAPLVLDQLGRSGPEAVSVEEPDDGVTDLLAYGMPPELYPRIWPEIPEPIPYPGWEPYHTISASAYYVPFIGLLTLALALYGLIRAWSKTWPWLLLALGIMLMALGPELAINGQRFSGVPVPYRLIEESLLGVLIRRPHRLNVFLGFPVAMMVTWGVADLVGRVRGRWGIVVGTAVALTLGALILWENPVPPLPTTSTPVPAWYQRLAEEPEQFGILQIPFHNRGFDKLYMAYQTVHGKPIMTGHVSRLPQEAFAFLETVPFLEPLNSIYTWDVVDESWVDPQVRDVSRQLRRLAEAGVRYIVLNKPLVPPGFQERWRDWVVIDPVYEDDEVMVYATEPQEGVDFAVTRPLVEGLGLIRASFAPQLVTPGGVIKVTADWGTTTVPGADYKACFTLWDARRLAVATACRELIPDWPSSTWRADDVARGAYVLPLGASVVPGDYSLELALDHARAENPVGETAVLGMVRVLPFAPQQATELRWGESISLRGYDLRQSQDELGLTLYWLAERPLAQSYKLFVHLVDPAGGGIVAQSDGVPRNWSYPTDIWEAGEIVRDPVALPLADVAPGTYELRLGWYAVDGAERLPACSSADCAMEAAEFHTLTEVVIPAR